MLFCLFECLFVCLLVFCILVYPAFQVVPSHTCVPCGGQTVFNCSTTAPANLGGGIILEGVGSQLWRIQTPDGTVTNLSSIMPHMVPAGYEFISPYVNVYTGLRVLNTNSTWNGTTFQCIAFDPSNVERQNNSAAAVTLEVGGECRKVIGISKKTIPKGNTIVTSCMCITTKTLF